ncbi:ribosome maturation factor RimP, partial [Bacillus licheniformis]
MGACTRRKSMSNKVIDTVSEMVQPILDNLQ